MWTVLTGKVEDRLPELPDNSFDSVVTDPPYALDFMGKEWDKFTPGKFQHWCEQWARECYRVLKPGGYLVAFGGTRTYHRLAAGIEDAGFEIRDSLHWIYGSGFPKSHDVSKAIDKAAGAEGEIVGERTFGKTSTGQASGWNPNAVAATGRQDVRAPSTEAAKQWQGWGTALKPAHEPIVLARKPLDARPLVTITEGIKTNNTVAANVLEHGTGALNIDACRVGTTDNLNGGGYANNSVKTEKSGSMEGGFLGPTGKEFEQPEGRWPSNILLSHSPYCVLLRPRRTEDPGAWDCSESCPVKVMDRQSGTIKSPKTYEYKGKPETERTAYSKGLGYGRHETEYGDTGGASRFFPEFEWDDLALEYFRYQAKAGKKERPVVEGVAAHPTVKPIAIMRWLAKLVTQPGGKVLEPFGGTGTTAEACELEGFDCTVIEREPDYVKLINKRMEKYAKEVALCH